MRADPALAAIRQCYDFVLESSFPLKSFNQRRALLRHLEEVDACFGELVDEMELDDARHCLDEALFAVQHAHAVLARLRRTQGWSPRELDHAESLLEKTGTFLTNELYRLDPRSGRRYERFQ